MNQDYRNNKDDRPDKEKEDTFDSEQSGYHFGDSQQQQTPPPITNTPFGTPHPQNNPAKTLQTYSIVALVVTLACCSPLGLILGIITLVKANALKKAGNISPELRSAKIVSIVVLVLGVLSLISSVIWTAALIASGEFFLPVPT